MAHVGVLQALVEARIPVDYIGGASMGSIIAAGWGMGMSVEEMRAKLHEMVAPKGALVEHRGLTNLSAAQVAAFELHDGLRVLQFSPLSFDASIFEIIMALGVGASLYLAPRDSLLPGPGLVALLRDHSITNVTLPPSVLSALPVEELPDLSTIVCAGEALPASLVDRWGRRR